MATDPSSELGRRAFLRVMAGTAMLAILAATPFTVLAQTAPSHPAPGSVPLKIGVIGAGREGGALGTAFAKAGHRRCQVKQLQREIGSRLTVGYFENL